MTNLIEPTGWKGMAVNSVALPPACALVTTSSAEVHAQGELTEVLFEQLGYLIQFSNQERDRLDRVKSILLQAFS